MSTAAANCDAGRTLSGNSGGGNGPTSVGNTPISNERVGNSSDKRHKLR